MVEQRGKKYHRERIREGLREEVDSILEGELADPRIGLAHVEDVVMAPDGKSARIFVAVDGTEEEVLETLDGLNAARGYIRHEIAERMGLRVAPDLHFQVVRAAHLESRIDELLQRDRKRRKRRAQ